MYTTCVIWLAFVPLYFGTGNNMAMRITSMSVTISLSASVTIACLFTPKVRCCWLLSGPKRKHLTLLLIFEIAMIVMNPTKLGRQSLWTILLIRLISFKQITPRLGQQPNLICFLNDHILQPTSRHPAYFPT